MYKCVTMAAVVGLSLAGVASANVVIDTVPVGNPGDAGELSGAGAGGYGPGRICGSVGYTYNIGKYEVTAGQYAAFLNAVAGVDTYALYNTDMSDTAYGGGIARSGGGTVGDPYTYTVDPAFVNRPVNWVSWGDSARFTNWLHNGQPTGAQNLSTTEDGAYYLNGAMSDADLLAVNRTSDWTWAIADEDEWYKAAYHKNDGVTGNYFDYPTSSDSAPGRDLTDVFGNNANYFDWSGAYPLDPPYYTTMVGEFQNSASPYGTFDQSGNVWEWNEGIVDWGYGWVSRGLRGGSFCDYTYNQQASIRGVYSHSSTYEFYYLGFRVVQIPEPAALSLLALGGLMVLRRRKR